MLKTLSNKKKLILILNIIHFISSEYEVNLYGESCINAPEDPPFMEACITYNTEETACCYATIFFQNRTSINKCIPVQKDARFALNHLTIFSFKDYNNIEYEDVTAKFECGQIDKLCGMDSPEKLFQCNEHSSITQSCCYLSTPTYTECILSEEKYDKETIFKLFEDSTVVCNSYQIVIKNINWFFYLFMIISLIDKIGY